MPSNTVVRARIDGQIKEEAAAVLDAMGLTVSDAGVLQSATTFPGDPRSRRSDGDHDRKATCFAAVRHPPGTGLVPAH